MDQATLAEASSVSRNTIVSFESGQRTPGTNNLAAIRTALEQAGVEFTNGDQPGVKMKPKMTGQHFKLMVERYQAQRLPHLRESHRLVGEPTLPLDPLGVEFRIDGQLLGRLTLEEAQAAKWRDGRFDLDELDDWIVGLLHNAPSVTNGEGPGVRLRKGAK